MTDQTLADLHQEDVEHARSYVQDFLDATYAPDRTLAVARVLQALLPSPPRPTLADMTRVERAECKWMQADAGQRGRVVIATTDLHGGLAALLRRRGNVIYEDHASVTPRPDLPRMKFPGDTPAPALPEGWRLADHENHGRVIVTNTTPDEDGHVYFVAPAPAPLGNDWHICTPEELAYLDQEADQ